MMPPSARPPSFEDDALSERVPVSVQTGSSRILVPQSLPLAFPGVPPYLAGLRSEENCDYYVSPKGSDSNDGRAPDATSTSGPFATLEAARDALRQAKVAAGGRFGRAMNVCLREGTYFRRTPFVLGRDDSGTAGAPVTYRPYRTERVIISGSIGLTKPEVDADGVWHFKNQWFTDNPKFIPEQAYVNGRLGTRARSPNQGFFFATKRKPGPDEQTGLLLVPENEDEFWGRPVDLAPFSVDANNPPIATVWFSFSASRAQIGRIDKSDGHLFLKAPLAIRVMLWNTFGQRYFIENAREAFDLAGEWYFDAAQRELLYRPLPFETPDRVRIDVPVTEELMHVAGDWKAGTESTPFFQRRRPISFINFEGLSFRGAAHVMKFGGDDGNQAAPNPQGAIVLEAAEDIRFAHCEFSRLGSWALDLTGFREHTKYPRLGVHLRFVGGNFRVTATHSLFHELGAGALQTIFDDGLSFTNNIVYRAGLIHTGMGAVVLHRAFNAKVEDNDFIDLSHIGVHLGYCWSEADCQTGGNRIVRNHLHRVGQRNLSDFGAIYSLGLQWDTSVIAENNIHEVGAYGEFGQPIGAGVYTDEGSNNIVIERNSILSTSGAALFHHWGAGLLFKHNYLSSEDTSAVKFVAAGTPKSGQPGRASLTFEGNVSSLQSLAQPYGFSYLDSHPGKTGTLSRTLSTKNLYYNASAPVDLSQNRSRGLDMDSVATGTQVFENPNVAPLRLKVSAETTRLGIPAFDLSGVGVTSGGGWRELAEMLHAQNLDTVETLNSRQNLLARYDTLGASEFGVARNGNTIVQVTKPDEAAFSRTVTKLRHPVSRVALVVRGETPNEACFELNVLFVNGAGEHIGMTYDSVKVSKKFEAENSLVVPYGTKEVVAGIRFLNAACARQVSQSPLTISEMMLFYEEYRQGNSAVLVTSNLP
jgi:hypothetical protein